MVCVLQRPFILLCITLVTVAFLASRTIDREIRFYDDGVYLINAKSIALGLGYRNLSLPDAPHNEGNRTGYFSVG